MFRTLIVDDHESNRILLAHYLGFLPRCDEARDGLEAVNTFTAALDEGDPYHLILMDLSMPVMDGEEAIAIIRAIEDERGLCGEDRARIIIVTAHHDMEGTVSVRGETFANAFLKKPVTQAVLIKTLTALVTRP